MFSSSLLTVNDVRLDFIKNNHGYFFINELSETRSMAYYCPFTKLIFYNPYTFLEEKDFFDIFKLKKRIEKKATCVSLFLSFHEDCGHLKNGINNTEDTPRQFYNSDLDLKISGISNIKDAGYIIEYFLNDDVINPEYIMDSDNATDVDSLMNYKNYINSDFNDLRKILKIIIKKNNSQTAGETKNKNLAEYNDDNKFKNMTVSELYQYLSKKPAGMTDEEYEKFVVNTKAYKQLKKCYNGSKKP